MFFPGYPPIDQRIQLDKCWRRNCWGPVDPDDELGLCAECKQELRAGAVRPVTEIDKDHGDNR